MLFIKKNVLAIIKENAISINMNASTLYAFKIVRHFVHTAYRFACYYFIDRCT